VTPTQGESSAILGDVALPGAEDAALRRTLATLTIGDPGLIDHWWTFSRAIAHATDRQHPRRTWWRSEYRGKSVFISLDPGECRFAAPDDDDSVILDAPDAGPRESLSQILARVRRGAGRRVRLRGPVGQLVSAADRVLANPGAAVSAAGVQRFCEAAKQAPDADPAEWPAIVHALYASCLHGFEATNHHFSWCMILLQIQKMTGRWIEEDAYERPVDFLVSFVHQLRDEEPVRRALNDIGEHMFQAAGKTMDAALKGHGYTLFCKRLAHAYHEYYVATKVAEVQRNAGLPVSPKYRLHVAEEGCATIHSGLMAGVDMLLVSPEETEREFVGGLDADGSSRGLRRAHASPFFPACSRSFLDVVLAAGLTAAPGPRFAAGFETLRALERESSQWDSFDLQTSWLHRALIRAYRTEGDTKSATRFARLQAAQLVLELALEDEPEDGDTT
jgi:hypothetical protein